MDELRRLERRLEKKIMEIVYSLKHPYYKTILLIK